VGNAAGEPLYVLAQNRNKVSVGISLMQEYWLCTDYGDRQLFCERVQLRGARREVSVVVKSAFTDGDHFWQACHFTYGSS